VEGYYALRVVIVGCESTGKTTLCQRLAEEFKTNWVAEYARSFCEEMLLSILNRFSAAHAIVSL